MPHDDPQPGPAQDAARRHVDWLVQRNRQDPGIDYAHVEPRPVRSVGIIGAGLMGTAIAAAHLKVDLPVVITDADEEGTDV